MPRKDGRPRSLPPFEPAGCYFAKGICPFHGVEHEFTKPKEEDNETAPSRPGRRG